MKPEFLIDNFERLADAPGGPEGLRELVLRLAAQGKLLPQESSDTSSEVLLDAIAKTKSSLQFRKPSTDDPNERRFNWSLDTSPTPDGWTKCLLGSYVYIEMGQSPPSSTYNSNGSGLPFFQGKAEFGLISPTAQVWCTDPKKVSEVNDILVSVRAPVGPTNIADTKCCIGRGLAALRCLAGSHPKFLSIVFRAYESELLQIGTGSTFKAISKKDLELLPLLVPPVEEQARIVAKVDELMAKCDELEKRQEAARETRIRVHKASLNSLVEATTPDELSTAWQRLADIFDALHITPESVKEVRETVLKLAIRGSLTDADPQSSTINDFFGKLEQFFSEKPDGEKIKKKKISGVEVLPEGPYLIPGDWRWVTFGSVVLSRDHERIPLSKETRKYRQGPYDYYGASGVIDNIDDYLFDEPLLLIGEDGANLVNRSTPIAFIAKGSYWVNNHAHVLEAVDERFLEYLEIAINATDLTPYVTGTAQPKMNQKKMNSIPVPIPPEDHQRRIVATVKSLMSICDRMDLAVREELKCRELLSNAMVHALAAA